MQFAGRTVPFACVTVLLLVLAGCGDRQIETAEYSGHQAMSSGHASEAVRDYRAALERARANDDGSAIATQGTNLAIAELADNKPDQAITDARELQAELGKRGRKPPPLLDLVIATALYRQGNMAQAGQVAAAVAAQPDPAIALRGRFLMGLVADAQHDTAGLLAASLVLAGQKDAVSIADATELDARLALARGEAPIARAAAMDAVKLRTELHDDRGAARCLAVAADATLAAGGRADAAVLYLRAGQGAAAVGDNRDARDWLGKAKALSVDADVTRAAMEGLANLGG